MNVFTFDDVYFFDRKAYDDCWYVSKHPDCRPSPQGYFDVQTCRYRRDGSGDGEFTEVQKREIEEILLAHRSEMDIKQFDKHLVRPSHYSEISRQSERFMDIIGRLKWMSRTEPAFTVAYDAAASRNPAYRLNRAFIRDVVHGMERVTGDEIEEFLHEVTEDTWVYDHYPAPGETYEDFYLEAQRKLTLPDPIPFDVTSDTRLFEIDGLRELVCVLDDCVDGGELEHYVSIGPLFARTPIPRAYIL